MLSKLYHDGNREKTNADDLFLPLSNFLKRNYDARDVAVHQPTSGTYGIFFQACIANEQKFIKTHCKSRFHRTALEKEIGILTLLYGSSLWIQRIDLEVEGDRQVFLLMDMLKTTDVAPNRETIKDLIKSYESRFAIGNTEELQGMYRFEQVCREASNALDVLGSSGLLKGSTIEACETYRPVWQEMARQPHFFCHGDLSNRNILRKDDFLVIVDWEDALWGPPCYDYYYWLTFFDQRRFYEKGLLQEGDKSTQRQGLAVMLLVVCLKCYLSYLNHSWRNDSLSFDQRIEEILRLKG